MGSLQASAPTLVVEYPFGVSWLEHLDSLASSLCRVRKEFFSSCLVLKLTFHTSDGSCFLVRILRSHGVD